LHRSGLDPLARLPWFEELRARPARAAADALSVTAELEATLRHRHHRPRRSGGRVVILERCQAGEFLLQ
jgi:hypothetical protein